MRDDTENGQDVRPPPAALDYARPDGERGFDPVARGRRLLIAATILGVFLLLLALPNAIYPYPPGFGSSCIRLPFALAGLITGVLGLYHTWGQSGGRPNLRWAAAASSFALLAVALTYTSVGCRLGFWRSRGAFEAAVAAAVAPKPGQYGVYRVYDITTDPGGGLWFEAKQQSVGFVEQWYFGFAFKPTPGTDPYGLSGELRLMPMGGGWYAFRTRDVY